MGELRRLFAGFKAQIHVFIPENCRLDPERTRRARLIVHFGFQGLVFGALFAAFYFAIGHFTGARIIVVCSAVFAVVPWFLRFTGRLHLAGHLIAGTMATGFILLTLVEGGIHSHAVAWLASVPLCALLILGIRPAIAWAGICFLAGTSIGVAALLGIDFQPLYDRRWHTLVDAAGNLGIILFLFTLGVVFELNRASALRRMETSLDELADSNEELAHLNNEKTEFLGIAAHDLRNPLSAVIGFADLLESEEEERVARTANLISRAGRRMLQLITDLLDANAIEEKSYGKKFETLDLRVVVETSIHHQHLSSERKQITLDFREGPPCLARADRQALLQILDNLVSNALKYSPLGSCITLTTRAQGEWAEFAVRDEGPGISAEDQKKLFRRHTRLSAKPTGGETSVGLGLSIVKRLAETMGGTVTCQSVPGLGATFILRLPTATVEKVTSQKVAELV